MDDLIRRQDAIDALDCINGVEEVLKSLPSAESKQKIGKWNITDAFPVKSNVSTIECSKHGIAVDTTQPETRQCIEDDCDVLWRAAREKGSRYDG